eukprot:210511-Hanusia_phi.AAC.1
MCRDESGRGKGGSKQSWTERGRRGGGGIPDSTWKVSGSTALDSDTGKRRPDRESAEPEEGKAAA